MARFIVKRLLFMAATMLTVSILLFGLLEISPGSVATKVLGPYTSQEQRNLWLEAHGYFRPLHVRYLDWLGGLVQGEFGESIRFKVPVAEVLWPRLSNTALLAALVLVIMVPFSLALGVLAGMKEGSPLDRTISLFSIVTTSVPEFASSVILAALFVFYLGLLPGTSTMASGFSWREMVLPVLVLVLYDFGYVARMVRGSMVEVMMRDYVRTAILKGLPYRTVILRHALRNAMIAPFTVILLQFNWLITGVVVTEVIFAYPGFGRMLLEAALFGDIALVEAATVIALVVAVTTQLIGDIGYMLLNPRIRFT